jgi:hypothetical protein
VVADSLYGKVICVASVVFAVYGDYHVGEEAVYHARY